MNVYATVLLQIGVIIFSLACLSRLVALLLGWFLSTLTKQKIKIGHVTLLGVHDIVVGSPGKFHLKIHHIYLVSKLFSNTMRLFGVFVGAIDIHITAESDRDNRRQISDTQKKKLKIPAFIIYLIQKVHFRVESVRFLLEQECISIHAYLSTGINLVFFPDTNKRFVSSHLALDHIEIKVKDDRTIYLNTSLGIKLDFLLAYHFESIETVKVSVDMLSVMIYEGLIDVLTRFRKSQQSNSIESVTKQKVPILNKILKIFPVLPKARSFRINNISCSVSDVDETRNMSFKIDSLSEEGAVDGSGKGIVETLTLNNAKMYINNTDFLSIKSIKISPLKVSVGTEVNMSVTSLVDTLVVQWFNTEIISWATALHFPTRAKQTSFAESAPSTTLGITTIARFTNLSVNLFEDNKSVRKLITLTLPSLDIHHSKSADKLSVGVTSKKLMLQLPIPLKIKKKLRDKLSVIQEYHLWGQVLDFKSLTLKVQKYRDTIKMELDMQSSVLEWNYHFSNLIMEVMPQFLIMLPVNPPSPTPPSKHQKLEIDCKIEELNVFLLSDEPGEVCSLLHLNKLVLENKGSRTLLLLENMYVHALERLPEIYLCNIELEEADTLLSVVKATMSCNEVVVSRDQTTRNVKSVSGEIGGLSVRWEPTQHRVLESCISKTKGSIMCIADLLMYPRTTTPQKDRGASVKSSVENVTISINRTSLNFITSPSNQIGIEITPLHLKIKEKLTKVKIADKIIVYMDSHQILLINDVAVDQVKEDAELLQIRATQSHFSPQNKAWLFKCREIRVFLPHKYGKDSDNSNDPTIAQAIDEAQNCFKMVKALHRAPRLASDGEALYADCKVDIKLIVVEFEDYNFDQRISQNYLIMQHVQRDNEAETQTVRHGSDSTNQQQLDLSELADSSFQQTSSTFWGTYYDYQLYYKDAREEPVKLATLLLSDVKFCACADETLNGHDNLVNMINQLDDGTSVPHQLRFTTLWGRVVSGECTTFSLQLRNFSSELVHIKNASLKGIVCGAEAVSPNHAIRKTRVILRKPWKSFELARGMNSLKYFYDLTLETSEMQMSWGPCFEPSYQFFGQSVDKLTKKSRDPSPLLPFWDKTRNLMRGNFALRSDVLIVKLLSEREPLNNSEYLSVCFNEFLFKWSNGLLTFDGDTVIKNNSESKYGECRIVTLPRLLLTVNMIWKTANIDPNEHWDCVPYDPKFVKPREDEEWDSFSNFRSVCLDMDILLTFAHGDSNSCPKVNLYSHTLKWLETWATVIGGTVSRPIFKGKLWNNLKPPKKKLTRHYRKVHFETDFNEAELEIWSSYRKRAGAKVTVERGKLEMTQKLALVSWPPIEGCDSEGNTEYIHLKRRPRLVWSTEKCSAHLTAIQGSLMGSLDSMSDNEFTESSERSPEHFLFSVNEVEYRQRGETSLSTESLNSTNSRDAKLYTHWIVISDVKGSINIDTRTLILAFLEQYENSRALSRDLCSEALRTITLEGERVKRRSPRAASAVFETSPNQSNDDLLSQFDEDFVTVVTGDEKSNSSREKLAAEQACSDSDIKTRQWSIQMTNGQIAMQGPELNGFVLLTTGKCQVLGTEHWPVLRGGEFFSKFSWTCIVEHVQYFATVDEAPECHIPWLDENMIGIKRSRYSSNQEAEAAETMMSEIDEQEESLKGIVREVFKHDTKLVATQLQRIVSRCGCLISFVTFGTQPMEDTHTSTEDLQYTTESMYSSDLLSAFSLRHKSLEVATNSHQYKMIIDCVNNLLLRTEGSKRSSIGRLLHAFSLMGSGEVEARKTIAALQKEIRECLSKIRDIERQLYDFNLGVQSPDKMFKTQKALVIEKQKLSINRVNLRLTISAFKEFKLKEGAINKDQVVDQLMEVRKNEICIDDANWTLTGDCGQIPTMDVNIQGGFAYSRTVYSATYSTEASQNNDFSSGHKFTLGHFCIRNLQNDRNPQNVLFPVNNDSGANPARHCLRVYLSQQHNPVGGIIINHHLEINLVPLVLRFETLFWREIQRFFVGEDKREDDGVPDYYDLDDSSSINPLNFEIRAQNSKRKFKFSSRKNIRSGGVDPHQALDEMSERSKKRFFNFVKIQQFPILISYKGKITVNEKTILFPDIEIKERTQTWKELALEIKKISVPKIALSLGKLKQSYTAPISALSNMGVGSNCSENERSQEVYRFLTGSDATDTIPKKKRGLGLASLRRNKSKKVAPPIPVRPTLVPNDNFVKECDNPGEWEDNSLGERINELKAMSEEPIQMEELEEEISESNELSALPSDTVSPREQLG